MDSAVFHVGYRYLLMIIRSLLIPGIDLIGCSFTLLSILLPEAQIAVKDLKVVAFINIRS